ncbi:hypothetical protein L2E82_33074 [Cichorium intybus]|uniref:Uncharacterized protein n=1 Tax=Cichorium intybus TaxID=13427 RepID=A0ACB9BJ73_CICIN|nr:hypothetical protein L2E82_33074 [Cichorium intybus]
MEQKSEGLGAESLCYHLKITRIRVRSGKSHGSDPQTSASVVMGKPQGGIEPCTSRSAKREELEPWRERKRKRKRKRERESGGGDDSWSVEDADAWMQVPDTPTMTTSLWNPPSSSSNSCNSTTDHHRYNNMVRLFKWRFLTPSAQPMTLICDF